MKSIILFFLGMLSPLLLSAQQVLTLEECYLLAEENYPLARQKGLLAEKMQSEIKILEREKLPKLDLNAQSTYQSEVIQFPGELPGPTIEPPNKDQYRATMDINQLIYGGGNIEANANLKEAELKTKQQEVEVNLYQIKSHINALYFNVLLLQEQDKLLLSKKKQLQELLQETASGIKNGMVLPAASQALQAEMLLLEQQGIQITYDREKALETLSLFTGREITTTETLINPEIPVLAELPFSRPELRLFDFQEHQLEASKELISRENAPRVFGFAQAGFGNPGLNVLDNSFQEFYMLGIKFNWRIFDWGSTREKMQGVEALKKMVAAERETFILKNQIASDEARKDLSKLKALIEKDKKIVSLREAVLVAKTSAFKNGTITSSDYISELNNLYEAKINQQLNEIRLAMNHANYRLLRGDL
jgi:outer membrane protein TolC